MRFTLWNNNLKKIPIHKYKYQFINIDIMETVESFNKFLGNLRNNLSKDLINKFIDVVSNHIHEVLRQYNLTMTCNTEGKYLYKELFRMLWEMFGAIERSTDILSILDIYLKQITTNVQCNYDVLEKREHTINLLQQENGQQKQLLIENNDQLKATKQQLDENTELIQTYKNTIGHLEADLSELKIHSDKNVEVIYTYKQMIDQMEKDFGELNNQMKNLLGENAKIIQQLDADVNERNEHVKIIAQLTEDVNQRNGYLKTIQQLESDMMGKNNQLDEMKKQLCSKIKAIEYLETDANQRNEQMNDMKRRLDENIKTIEYLEMSVNEYRTKYISEVGKFKLNADKLKQLIGSYNPQT